MNYTKLLMLVLCLCSCASHQLAPASFTDKTFEATPATPNNPIETFNELYQQVGELNRYIGSYPPKFIDNTERDLIHKHWLTLVAKAQAFNTNNPDTEKSLYLLSELYRQGHNMDVKGSGEKAIGTLNTCLSLFPTSVPCNFSACYFYLSIDPIYLDRAEKSLFTLKQHFLPNLNDEVEAGYVFLYLYRQNVPMAKRQIDHFIESFPASSRVPMFTDMRNNLGDTIEWNRQ